MLKKFFCMHLNTAGVVIGWVEAGLSFVASIISMCVIIYCERISSNVRGSYRDDERIEFFMMTGASIYLAFSVINLTASVLLVAGTMKKRHLMLTPFLVNSGLYVMFSLLLLLISIGFAINGKNEARSFIGFSSLSTGFDIYVWCAVYSLYKQCKINTDQETLLQSINPPDYTKI